MYVMTPFTSLLVLENEEMNKQYKVDRGRKDHWVMYACPAKIPVVYEPLDGQPGDPKKGVKPDARQVLKTIVVRSQQREPLPTRIGQIIIAGDVVRARHALETGLPEIGLLVYGRPEKSVSVIDAFNSPTRVGSISFSGTSTAGSFIGSGKPALYTARKADRDQLFSLSLGYFGGGSGSGESLNIPVVNSSYKYSDVSGVGGTTGVRFLTESDIEHYRHISLPQAHYLQHRPQYPRELAGMEAGLRVIEDAWLRSQGPIPDVLDQVESLISAPQEQQSTSLLYTRPAFNADDRLFYDLVGFAPGMNTSLADIQAVVEAEAAPSLHTVPGKIDPEARKLIDKAREAGWQTITLGE